MRYTFGESHAASDRLRSIADFFNPLAATFIRSYVCGPVGVGLDLGCGPGFTTDMLAGVLSGARIYGLDNSPVFLVMAREKFSGCEFLQHDVTVSPFPVRADVMYERFVLPHLKSVVDLVNRWVGELCPGGLLFLDELEAIETDVPVFRRYLETNAALVRSQGADLYVGKTLAEGRYDAAVLHNASAVLPVANSVAARWFHPNTVTIWEKEKVVLDLLSSRERRDISQAVEAIRDSGDQRQNIVWTMRRIVLGRRPEAK